MTLARDKVKALKQLRVSVDNILPVSGGGVQNVDIAYNVRGPDLHVLQENHGQTESTRTADQRHCRC